MSRRDHFDAGHGNPDYFRQLGGEAPHGQVRGMPADPAYFDDAGEIHEGMRSCDSCGKVEDAGSGYDWVNGECEDCDPSIRSHAANTAKAMGPERLN